MLLHLLLVLVVEMAVVGGQVPPPPPGSSSGLGMGPMCANFTMDYKEVIQKAVERMKDVHRDCIRFNEDEADIERVIRALNRAVNHLFHGIQRGCKRRMRAGPREDPCTEHVQLELREEVDPVTNHSRGNFTVRNDTTMNGCHPGRTWFKLADAMNSTEAEDMLIKHHPEVSECNNITNSIVMERQRTLRRNRDRPTELTYRIDFSDQCEEHMTRRAKLYRVQCDPRDPANVVYRIDGFTDVCPEKPECDIPDFEPRRED